MFWRKEVALTRRLFRFIFIRKCEIEITLLHKIKNQKVLYINV